MDIGALLIVVGLAVVTAAFIARPLLDGRGHEPEAAERRLSALRAEHDQLLALLQELEMDFVMGKIEPEVHRAERAAYLARGGEVLREIDDLVPEPAVEAPAETSSSDLEARVARLRERAGGFCGQCGAPLARGDRFCSRCGHPAPEAPA